MKKTVPDLTMKTYYDEGCEIWKLFVACKAVMSWVAFLVLCQTFFRLKGKVALFAIVPMKLFLVVQASYVLPRIPVLSTPATFQPAVVIFTPRDVISYSTCVEGGAAAEWHGREILIFVRYVKSDMARKSAEFPQM